MKAQTAFEYLVTYSWAILIVAIAAALLYIYVAAPQNATLQQCNFGSDIYCSDILAGQFKFTFGVTTTYTNAVVATLYNRQTYPISNPVLTVQLNGINYSTAPCITTFIAPGGVMICGTGVGSAALLNGSMVSGKLFLIAQYCGLSATYLNTGNCATAANQLYAGSFITHAETFSILPILSIGINAINTTQQANPGERDPINVTVYYGGKPLSGATITFSVDNPSYSVGPKITTTNMNGNAVSYVWPSVSGPNVVHITAKMPVTTPGNTVTATVTFT